MEEKYFQGKKEKARTTYDAEPTIRSPFVDDEATALSFGIPKFFLASSIRDLSVESWQIRPLHYSSSQEEFMTPLRLKGEGTDNHIVTDSADGRAAIQQPEVNVDALLTGRRNVGTRVVPLIDDIVSRWHTGP